MIPLNKPGHIKDFARGEEFTQALVGRQQTYLFTAGDGLNLIYRELYAKHGAMRVAVSPLTCFQAIYPIVMNGHTPVLVDIQPDTLLIDSTKIPADVDAIEVIHLGGCPVDIEAIGALNKIIIEDCAQAMGAKYNGRYVGTFGQYSVYSMLKNLYQPAGLILGVDTAVHVGVDAAHVGGAVQFYKTVKTWLEERASYRTSIINQLYSLLLRLRDKEGGFRNVVRGVGNVDSLAESLHYIDALNRKRVENAKRVIAAIDPAEFVVQQVPEGGESTWNRILMRSLHRPACDVIRDLRAAGIAANNLTQSYVHPWQRPIWEDEMLAKYYDADLLPIYTEVVKQVVAIPNSPFMSEDEIEHIINIIKK